jgi:tRNA A-37 threonylcarbamoyl transferase component Bud32
VKETLPPTSDHSVDRLIAEYLQAIEAGKIPSREELLTQHPSHANELNRFFADYDRMDRGAASLRVTGPHTTDFAETTHGTLLMVRYFGDYELLEEIARGGMGVVYKARQVSLARLVALKMLLKGEHASTKDAARFQTEAESAASLDHPNIVPIFEIGSHEGRQYLAMKFIEGQSLAKVPRGDARTEAARLLTIARAVHFAHQRGVLHRDLKPGNILVDDAGTHFVADFGLAKRIDAQVSLSETGDVIGTPRYMPPEQANGRKDLTTAVDTYALGVILYERLTGRTPYQGQTLLEILRQLREEEPAKPRSIVPTLDRDLETICVKCLEREPGQRYASTGELAEELDRWLRGEPIQARPVGQMERAWRWCKRYPLVSGLSAGVAASLLLATGLSLGLANWALGEKTRANENADRANEATDRAETVLAKSFLRPFDGRLADTAIPNVTDLQVVPLWELAQNRGERVWFKTIEEALKEPRTMRQLVGNANTLLHAAVGLDPAKRAKVAELLLGGLRDPGRKEQHTDYALLLVSLGGLSDGEANLVAQELVAGLPCDQATKKADLFASVADSLGQLSQQLNNQVAVQACDWLVTVQERADSVNDELEFPDFKSDHYASVEGALKRLALRLEPADAGTLASRLTSTFTRKYRYTLETRAETLVAFVERLPPTANSQFREQAARAILRDVKQANEAKLIVPELYQYLAAALVTIAEPLEVSLRDQIFVEAATMLGAWPLSHANYSRNHNGVYGFKLIAPFLNSSDAEDFTKALATAAMKETKSDGFDLLAEASVASSQNARASVVATSLGVIAERIVKEPDNNRVLRSTVASAMPHQIATLIADRLADYIVSKKADVAKGHIARMLAKVANRLDQQTAIAVCLKASIPLFTAIDDEQNDRLYDRVDGLQELAPFLQSVELKSFRFQVMTRLVDKIRIPTNAKYVRILATAIAKLTSSPASEDEMAYCRIAMHEVQAEITRCTSHYELPGLVDVQLALAKHVEADFAKSIFTGIITKLVQSTEHNPNYEAGPSYLTANLKCVNYLERDKADAHAVHIFSWFEPMWHSSDGMQLYADDVPKLSMFIFHRIDRIELASRAGSIAAALTTPSLLSLTECMRAAEPFPARFSDEFMVELLHRPVAVGPWRRAILDALGTRHRRHFRDQWDFVRFAQERKLPLAFTASPKRQLANSTIFHGSSFKN